MNMKAFQLACALLLVLPAALSAGESVSLTVTNITTEGERRSATIEVSLPKSVSITKDADFVAIVGTPVGSIQSGGFVADAFGPPQVFALKGTSWQIAPRLFRVRVILPLMKVTVKFQLEDRKKILYEESREL
jgi:hypothetical protein